MKRAFSSLPFLLRAGVCALCMTASTAAHAENLFLLQLGSFSSKPGADEAYVTLNQHFSEELAGKQYVPRKSRSLSGNNEWWRVLVGPYESRKQAMQSCVALKSKGQDCFVVETAIMSLDDMAAGNRFVNQQADIEPIAQAEAADAALPAASAQPEAVATASSNININSHSVYAEKPRAAQLPDINIVESISNLFGSEPGAEAEPALVASEANNESGDKSGDALPEMPAAPVESVEAAETASNTANTNEVAAAVKAVEVEAAQPLQPAETDTAVAEAMPEQPDTTTSRSGDVEIAEAIPVPLTEAKDVPVTQAAPMKPTTIADAPKQPAPISGFAAEAPAATPAPVETPYAATPRDIPSLPQALTPVGEVASPAQAADSPAPAVIAAAPEAEASRFPPTRSADVMAAYQRQQQASRVLQVSIFQHDREAFQCLSTIHNRVPASALLRARIIKSTTGQAVLRLGPVNDASLEAAVCDAISACEMEIQCRLISEQKLHQQPTTTPYLPAASDADANANMDAGNHPMPKNFTPAASDVVSAAAASSVWVQLATSSSESDARDQFATLKSIHSELLGGFKPVINSPENASLAGEVYRVRVGPFDDRAKAHALCAELSSKGVGCLVLAK